MTKKKIDLYDAEHPSRKLAILVMEKIQQEFKQTLKGDNWYLHEDYLTNAVDTVRNYLHKNLK